MPPNKRQVRTRKIPKDDFCTKNILFPGQYGPTCWFNALLLCALYSQRSRKLMLNVSKYWNIEIRLYRLFYYILHHKYVKTKKPNKDHKFFENVTPQVILKLMNRYDSINFMANNFTMGFYPVVYLRTMYELLGVSCIGITIYADNKVVYDRFNKIQKVSVDSGGLNILYQRLTSTFITHELTIAPDILYIRTDHIPYTHESLYMQTREAYELDNKVNPTNIANIQSKADTIVYNNETYDLDSVILPEMNYHRHVVAGITCHNKRYVYNGWIAANNSPCELMRFDWNVNSKVDFCISPAKCGLQFMTADENCYSFNDGERLLIYVKRGAAASHHSPSPTHRIDYVPYRKFSNSIVARSPDTKKQKVNSPASVASSYASFVSIPTPNSQHSPTPPENATQNSRHNSPKTPNNSPVTPRTTPGSRQRSPKTPNTPGNSPPRSITRTTSDSRQSTPKTPKTP